MLMDLSSGDNAMPLTQLISDSNNCMSWSVTQAASRSQKKNPEGEQEFARLWLVDISHLWSAMSILTLLDFMFNEYHIHE